MRKVPFFNYPELYLRDKNHYIKLIDGVLSRGAFILQKEVEDFEHQLAEYVGVKHAVGLADGTMAIYLALRAAGIGHGDEVIVSTHTFIATCSAIVAVGGKPVPVDCTEELMMDVNAAARAITSATKAIMPTQLNGRTMAMESLLGLAADNNLIVVEDSCQGLGSKYKNKMAGTFGLAGTYSFYPAKVLGAFGDAGALVTNDDGVAMAVRQMRDHGRDEHGIVRRWGINGRIDNLHAAILLHKLKYLDLAIAKRRELAETYHDKLVDLESLILPQKPNSDPAHFDTFQNYEIQAKRRDELQEYLKEHGIGTLRQWGGVMTHQFPDLGLESDAPYADNLSKQMLLLPMNDLLSADDVLYVCEKIRSFYGA